jgi:D-alanyl-D-alanine carboxypeptidase
VLLTGALGLVVPWGRTAASASPLRVRDDLPRPTQLEREEADRLLVVVTKEQPLSPRDYAPSDLVRWRETAYEMRAEVADQLHRLFRAADKRGHRLTVISGYRSYQTQAETYEFWVEQYGRASADASSARPGHSEHQTGLAVDIDSPADGCYLDACFGGTAAGEWVAAHAWRFGFVLSYPQGYRERTGYTYEPWHLRYVGPRAALTMRELGVVLLEDLMRPRFAAAGIGSMLGTHP